MGISFTKRFVVVAVFEAPVRLVAVGEVLAVEIGLEVFIAGISFSVVTKFVDGVVEGGDDGGGGG